MQSGETSRPSKRARLLSPRKIRELVMDSDSDEASATEDDELEPRLLSRWSISSLSSASTDSSASLSVQNVAGQHPQPTQWTLHPYPRGRVVHIYWGSYSEKQ